MSSCCTFIGAPVSSTHERYVWRNVCQPNAPYLPSAIRRASWINNRAPFGVGWSCRHQTPEVAPHVGQASIQQPDGRRCRF